MREKKFKILNLVLENSPFDGWNNSTFIAAVEELGLSEEVENIFPYKIKDLENYYFELADGDLKTSLNKINFEKSSVRDIIKSALILRFKYYSKNKESLRQLTGINLLKGLPMIIYQGFIIW